MTERKPANVSFETWVDAQIREARDRGEFDNLPGHGKPLANVDGHDDDMWWVKQWLKRENVGFTPPGLALRKSVEDVLESVGRLRTEKTVRDVVGELNDRIRQMNRVPPADGPPTNLSPLDVDRVLELWAEQRPRWSEVAAEGPESANEQPVLPTPASPAGISERAQAMALLFVTACEVGALELLFGDNPVARTLAVASIVVVGLAVRRAWKAPSSSKTVKPSPNSDFTL